MKQYFFVFNLYRKKHNFVVLFFFFVYIYIIYLLIKIGFKLPLKCFFNFNILLFWGDFFIRVLFQKNDTLLLYQLSFLKLSKKKIFNCYFLINFFNIYNLLVFFIFIPFLNFLYNNTRILDLYMLFSYIVLHVCFITKVSLSFKLFNLRYRIYLLGLLILYSILNVLTVKYIEKVSYIFLILTASFVTVNFYINRFLKHTYVFK